MHDNGTDGSPPPERERRALARLLQYTHLGFVLPAATVTGWLLGAALDRWLGTNWINIAGLVVGIVAGFSEIVRVFAKLQRDQ